LTINLVLVKHGLVSLNKPIE